MNVTKCLNGHFFDADKYEVCPHCGAAAGKVDSKMQETEKKGNGLFGKKKKKDTKVEMHQLPDKSIGKTFGVFSDDRKGKGEDIFQSRSNSIKCPVCGEELPADALFCRECGSKIENAADSELKDTQRSIFENKKEKSSVSDTIQCPSCGSKLPAEANFCRVCGSKIENAANATVHVKEQKLTQEIRKASVPIADHKDIEPKPERDFLEEASSAARKPSLESQIRNVTSNNDGKTMGFFSTGDSEESCDPVVGWLVCIKGNHFGESFIIVSGRNSVGRGISNKIILSKDNTVSREKHAWITYDPKHRDFYLQPGEGSGLSYLNGETMMASKKMAAKDLIEFGNGTYMLIPLCGEDFSWEEYLKE